MKRKRTLIIVVCLVCIGMVLGIVFTRGRGSEVTLTTVEVKRGNIVKTVLVDGNLEMPNKAYLSFGVTGTVKEVLVAEGYNVTKGQILARLDAPSLESSVETVKLQVKIAEEQVKAAEAQYEIALINLKAAGNTTAKKVLQEQVNAAEANWEVAKLNLKMVKLSLESAKLNLEKAILAAPFDGVVASISIIEGQEISGTALATPAVTVVDTSKIEMSGFIDELDIAMVRVGQEASVSLDALPDTEVNGEVTFISPTSTNRAGIVSYATTIALESPSAELKDGMSATAEVIIERRDDVLLIPNRVIQGTLQNPTVVVLVDGQQKDMQITLGLSDGINTEVLSGLEEGEKVVVPAPTSTQQSSSFFGT